MKMSRAIDRIIFDAHSQKCHGQGHRERMSKKGKSYGPADPHPLHSPGPSWSGRRSTTSPEMVADRDIWGNRTASYLHMLYERLALIRGLSF